MPLSVALASIGLAIAPAVAASISIAGKLYRLYRARGNATLSHIPRVLDKISKELERTSKEFSAAQLQSFNDRLNGATLLYNALITDHSVVDAKTRKASFLEVKKSLIRLLEEIKVTSIFFYQSIMIGCFAICRRTYIQINTSRTPMVLELPLGGAAWPHSHSRRETCQ
ncbi:hypothetical protein DL96DRAFT_727215 [Flagelloscypha sp. PMI_526]|nr:hypothetical protein DL96DRAFT_727215 [Flagelloscypha sp. PMI_526]